MSSVKKIFNTKKVAVDGFILGGSEGGQKDGLRINNKQVVRIDDLPINSQGIALLAYDSTQDQFIAGTLTDMYGQNINVGFQQLGSQTASGSGSLASSSVELADVSDYVLLSGSGPVSGSGIYNFVYDTLDNMTDIYVASGSSHYVTSSGIYTFMKENMVIIDNDVTSGSSNAVSSSGISKYIDLITTNTVSSGSGLVTASGVYNYIRDHVSEAHDLVHVLNSSSSGSSDPITASGVWNYLQTNTSNIDLVDTLNGLSSGSSAAISASGVWNYLAAASYVPMSALENTVSSGSVLPVTGSGIYNYLKANFLWNSDALEKDVVVSIVNPGDGNKYNFNNITYNDTRKIALTKGTYTLTGITSSHPIYLKNSLTGATSTTGLPGISITGTEFIAGTSSKGDAVTAYSGTVTITVTEPFDTLSYVCFAHGYMGGENKLVYSDPPSKASTVLNVLNASGSGSSYPVSASGIWNYLQTNTSNIDLVHILNGSSSGSSAAISASGIYNYLQTNIPELRSLVNTLDGTSSGSSNPITASGVYNYIRDHVSEAHDLVNLLNDSSSGSSDPITASGVWNYLAAASYIPMSALTSVVASGSLLPVTASGVFDFVGSSLGSGLNITANNVHDNTEMLRLLDVNINATLSASGTADVTFFSSGDVKHGTPLYFNKKNLLFESGEAPIISMTKSIDVLTNEPILTVRKQDGSEMVFNLTPSSGSGTDISMINVMTGNETSEMPLSSSGVYNFVTGRLVDFLPISNITDSVTQSDSSPISSSGVYDEIYNILDLKKTISVLDSSASGSSNPVSASGILEFIALNSVFLRNEITEDTKDAPDPVTASGVYKFVKAELSSGVVTVDTVSIGSSAPVSSSGVFTYINTINPVLNSSLTSTIEAGSLLAVTASGIYDYFQNNVPELRNLVNTLDASTSSSGLPITASGVSKYIDSVTTDTVILNGSGLVTASGVYNYIRDNVSEAHDLVNLLNEASSGSSDPITASGVWNYLAASYVSMSDLQNTVIEASPLPVTGSGIYDYLHSTVLPVVNTLNINSSGSSNPVSASGVYTYLQNNTSNIDVVDTLNEGSSGSSAAISASGVYKFMAQNALFVIDVLNETTSGSGEPITASGVWNYIDSVTTNTVILNGSGLVTASGVSEAISNSVIDTVFTVESSYENDLVLGSSSTYPISASGVWNYLQAASYVPMSSLENTVTADSVLPVTGSGIYDYFQNNIPELRNLVNTLDASTSSSGLPITASGVWNYIRDNVSEAHNLVNLLNLTSSGSSDPVTASGVWGAIQVSSVDTIIAIESSYNNSLDISSSGSIYPVSASGVWNYVDSVSSSLLEDSDALEPVSAVTIVNPGDGNKYNFSNITYSDTRKIALTKGTYTLTGITSSHPLYLKNSLTGATSTTGTGLPGITITGTLNTVGTSSKGDAVTAYYGTVTITVTEPFDTLSYVCFAHGYMGGENKLVYNNAPVMTASSVVLGNNNAVTSDGVYNYLQVINPVLHSQVVNILDLSTSGSGLPITASGVWNYIDSVTTNTVILNGSGLVTASGVSEAISNSAIDTVFTVESTYENDLVLGSSSTYPISASGVWNYLQAESYLPTTSLTNDATDGLIAPITSSGAYNAIEAKKTFSSGVYIQTDGLSATNTLTELTVDCTNQSYIAKSVSVTATEIETVELVTVSSGLNFVLSLAHNTTNTAFAVKSTIKIKIGGVNIPTICNLSSDLNIPADERGMISGIVIYNDDLSRFEAFVNVAQFGTPTA